MGTTPHKVWAVIYLQSTKWYVLNARINVF